MSELTEEQSNSQFEIGRVEGTYEPDPNKDFISSHHCYCNCNESCGDRLWREGRIQKCAVCNTKNPLFDHSKD